MICLLLANVRLNKVVTKWLNISLNDKAFYAYLGLPRWFGGKKNPSANAGDTGWIPGWGRSPGGGNGNPLQYSCLENHMDRGAWRGTVHGVAKSQIWLSDWACTHACLFYRLCCSTHQFRRHLYIYWALTMYQHYSACWEANSKCPI